MHRQLIAMAMLVAMPSATYGQDRALPLDFSDREAWHTFADEPWWSLVDMRDMLNVFHPLKIPQTGNAAGAWREVTIPADWEPPFVLRFFCADDYFADAEKHKPGQPGTESFFEHRFKQVLVDETIVWNRDVIDENTHRSPTIFEVDVTPHMTPGKPFRLTFRVFDKLSTEERNDRDVWFIGGTWYTAGDKKTEEPPRFHTAAWFADPVIGEKPAVDSVPAGKRPHEATVAARHEARWPMPPRGEPMESPAQLEVVAPAAIPVPGFPVTCGIPMPPGTLTEAEAVRLQDSQGREWPIQTRTTGLWPDGTIRWLLVHTIAPAGTQPGEKVDLFFEEERRAERDTPLIVRQIDSRATVDTGAVRIEMGGDPSTLIDAVYLGDGQQAVMTDLAARMSILADGEEVTVNATSEKTEVLENGPVMARIELSGSLDTEDRHMGSFVFRLYAYAGLPTVQTNFRIVNEVKPVPLAGTAADAPLDVTDLAMVATIAGAAQGETTMGVVDGPPQIAQTGPFELVQDTHEHFTATNDRGPETEGKQAQGWLTTAGQDRAIQVSMTRFWQQYPKSLAVDERGLVVGLFTPTVTVPAYRPRFGEAKRHDVWLTFADHAHPADTQDAIGRLADEPPRLFCGDWFCRSGGVNVLDPAWFDSQPQLKQYVADAYGDVSSARVTGQFGIRDFGDMPYGSSGQWLNGYWAMVQGALNWGLASGDQRWLERSFEIARHIADVDCVHLPADHPDWQEWHGVTCALGTDHSVHNPLAKWPAFQIGESLILHHWMSGDPDSLDAGLANADYILRSSAGWQSASARNQARPMLTLLRAWQATGDDKYREGAKRYLDLQWQTKQVIDWRRGAYIQPTYQNWRCISAGLNSMYGHDVYEYYRLTGDVNAAQMVVALADSVYAESMLPQEEGLGSFLFYVRYSRDSWYYTQMALLFHMAYDLTDDIRFLRAGRAAFARYLLCVNADRQPMYQPFHNFGWLDPEYGGWAQAFSDVVTEPVNITSQTPDPDPANYRPK